jgi:hypothetical protein
LLPPPSAAAPPPPQVSRHGSHTTTAVNVSDDESGGDRVLCSGEWSQPVCLDKNESDPGTAMQEVAATGLQDGRVVVAWPDAGQRHADSITITEGNVRRVVEPRYLEDSVIDIYLKYLHLHKLQQLNRRADPRDIFVCSSHLYTHLRGKRDVSKWLKRVDICSKRFVLVPINQGAKHWSLVLICNPGAMAGSRLGQEGHEPMMLHFDSLHGTHSDADVKTLLGSWLCSRWQASVKAKEAAEREASGSSDEEESETEEGKEGSSGTGGEAAGTGVDSRKGEDGVRSGGKGGEGCHPLLLRPRRGGAVRMTACKTPHLTSAY